jgi:hypothetical protein
MSRFVEFVKYRRLKAISEEEFLQIRSAAITAVKAAHPALVAVPVLSRQPDGSWVDVWIYETKEAAEAANAGAGDIPEFAALAGVLGDVEIEAGIMPQGAVSPL